MSSFTSFTVRWDWSKDDSYKCEADNSQRAAEIFAHDIMNPDDVGIVVVTWAHSGGGEHRYDVWAEIETTYHAEAI